MSSELKNLMPCQELEELLCKYTIDYTCDRLRNLINKSECQSKDFNSDLLKADESTDVFQYEYIDEVEELERDFPLHNKSEDFKRLLNKLSMATSTKEVECYLGETYNTYSNFCSDCGKIFDYLNVDKLKKYIKTEILNSKKFINTIKGSNLLTQFDEVIDLWVSTLSTFNCTSDDTINDKFQESIKKYF
ncbi:MAG: hypothetical protein ACRC7R_03975 [Sarcina sp.]